MRNQGKPPIGGWTVTDEINDRPNVRVPETGTSPSLSALASAYRAQASTLGLSLDLNWCRQRVEYLICQAHPGICWGGPNDRPFGEAPSAGRATVKRRKCGGCGKRRAK